MDSQLTVACGLLGSFGMAKRLIDDNANVNVVDEQSHTTALHVAAMFGSLNIVKLLLQHGAEVNIPNKVGNTPLMQCIRYISTLHNTELENVDHYQVVDTLIEANADVNHCNNLRSSPLHAAARSGSRRVSKLLVKHGAIIDALDESSRMPVDMVFVGTPHNLHNQRKVAVYLYDEMARVDREHREKLCRDEFLPLAMGIHPRLGDISCVRVLSADILRDIWHALRRTHNLPIEDFNFLSDFLNESV
jgi:hypothetical protein